MHINESLRKYLTVNELIKYKYNFIVRNSFDKRFIKIVGL